MPDLPDSFTIRLAEQDYSVPAGCSVLQLKEACKPDADIVVFNGAPLSEDCALAEGDAVVFLRRGEVPAAEELEALMAARHTPGVHAVLKRATVGIAGVGGLGTAVATALARVGVGRLILADFDVVEPSNLNRQQFFVDQLGMPKVDAMSQNLARINPYITVDSRQVRVGPENMQALFEGVEVMVEAFDAADQKAMLAECFPRLFPGVPLVMATGLAGHMPSNTIQTRKMGKALFIVGDWNTAAQPGTGLMAPRVGVAAHHQANAVLRLLLGQDPAGD